MKRRSGVKLPRGHYITADVEIFMAKPLITLGRSKVVVLPRLWVDIWAPDGWVEIEMPETGEIVLRPMTLEKLEAVETDARN